jgi:hypothetical protein
MSDLDLTDEQIDALVNEDQVSRQAAPEEEKAVPQPQESAYAPMTFTANGKEITADNPDLAKKWMSMGYNYGQHINDFKKQQEEFSTRQQEFDSKYSLYEKIDQEAQKNPQWWEHVQNSFNQMGSSQAQTPQEGEQQQEVNPEIQALKEEFNKELDDLRSFKNEVLAEKNARKMEEEDQALKAEVQSIRDNHKDLDWTTPNEEGKTLEYRVLEHAQNKGINSFEVAFKHMMHDELVNRARQVSLDTARKEIQRNHKLGLLGETPEPLKKVIGESDPKSSSWEDLENEALKEYGLAN